MRPSAPAQPPPKLLLPFLVFLPLPFGMPQEPPSISSRMPPMRALRNPSGGAELVHALAALAHGDESVVVLGTLPRERLIVLIVGGDLVGFPSVLVVVLVEVDVAVVLVAPLVPDTVDVLDPQSIRRVIVGSLVLVIVLVGVGEVDPSSASTVGWWRTSACVEVPTSVADAEHAAQCGGDLLVVECVAGSSEEGPLFVLIRVGPLQLHVAELVL